MSINFKNNSNWFSLDELIEEELKEIENNMRKAVKVVQNEAKILCPVDTGRLRNSIVTGLEVQEDEIIGTIQTNVEYADIVHDGAGKRKPQPFLKNAAENKEQEVLKILQGG